MRIYHLDPVQYDKSPASCQALGCLYNREYLLFCLAMSTTFAETTELELVVLPVAMSDEDPGEEEETDEEMDPDDEDLEGLDEDEDEDGDEESAE